MTKERVRYSPEVRERAVRMVLEHVGEYASRWAAVCSVASKIGCSGATLYEWVKRWEIDKGARAGVPTEVGEKMKAMERLASHPLAIGFGNASNSTLLRDVTLRARH